MREINSLDVLLGRWRGGEGGVLSRRGGVSCEGAVGTVQVDNIGASRGDKDTEKVEGVTVASVSLGGRSVDNI